MSDRDTDQMDKAYAQAEALLDDAAARAARRARVLAAVSEVAPAAATSPPRRTAWRPAGWLAAASVAGISLFVAIQINRPPVIERPTEAPAPATAPPSALEPASPPLDRVSPAPPAVAPPAPATVPAPAATPASPEVTIEAGKRSPSFEDAPVAVREADLTPLPAPVPSPPPPPPSAAAPSMGRLVRPPAAAAPRARPPMSSSERIEELVVTGQRREAPNSPEALAQRLRDAAAAGQSREISVLLAREVPIDAVDDEGETALMKAVQARQLDAVALLRRRGASLDLKNEAGRSVRDMAAAAGDRDLNSALGLDR